MAIDTTTEVTEVAARVREAIAACGVRQSWLCETTGIPATTMRRRLAAATPFNVAELSRIAAALRLDTHDLLTGRVAA